MPVLTVGSTHIPYEIRRSGKARRQSITVTPDAIEVVAPQSTPDDEITEFVQSRRRWVYDHVETMRERVRNVPPAPKLVSGSKIPYRGRMLRLRIGAASASGVAIRYSGGFHITVPESMQSQERDGVIAGALTAWMKQRLAEDIAQILARHASYLDLEVPRFRIKAHKHLWGSCGKNRVLNFNWRLIFAPRPVLEYVAVHELCHLKHRNHSPQFWREVKSLLPNYRDQREWLQKSEALIPPDL